MAEAIPNTIRHLGPDDIQRCKAIRLACLADAPFAFGSTFEGESAEPDSWWATRLTDGYWIVAEQAGEDLGVAMLMRQGLPASFQPDESADARLPEQSDYLWIRAVWIRPEHRGRGIVDQLCGHLVERAAQAGEPVIILGVRQGNDRAQRAYERMGFAAVGTFNPVTSSTHLTNSLMALPLGGAPGRTD